MPVFTVKGSQLVGLVRVQPGPELYERQIEDLLWENLDAFVGEDLFRVCRQGQVGLGRIPDVIALDSSGRVVVIEVKRSIERTQLSQCLEYAGWARTARLDELARLYHKGPDNFFADWQEFTESTVPLVVNPSPRLVLVAADFDPRTSEALAFLEDSGTPVERVPVTIYQDADGERLLHIDTNAEVAAPPPDPDPKKWTVWKLHGRRFEVGDLLEAGMVSPGEPLVWPRPRSGQEFHATITDEGKIRLEDGSVFDTPSAAAIRASGLNAVPGWEVWRLPNREDRLLIDLRAEFFAARRDDPANWEGH